MLWRRRRRRRETAVYLSGAGKEAGHVDEGDDGDVEGVAETDEAGALGRGVDVQTTGKLHRVVAHHADRALEKHHHEHARIRPMR
jgi:hypothetical protein